MSKELFVAVFALSCMCTPFLLFYCLFRLNLSKKQNVIFIVVSYMIYYFINYVSYGGTSDFFDRINVYLVIALIDVGYAMLCIKFLTEKESVIIGILVLTLCSRVSSTLSLGIFGRIFPETTHILEGYTYEGGVPLYQLLIFGFINLCSLIVIWKPARFIKLKADEIASALKRNGITYILNILSILTIAGWIVVMAINYGRNDFAVPATSFVANFVYFLSASMPLYFSYLFCRRLYYRNELKQLQNKCNMTEKRYETLLEENESLRRIRHELNKHLSAANGLSSFQPDSEIMEYVREFKEAGKYLSEISQCGNIYIDTQMEQYYKKLRDQKVLFETVLEPIRDREEIANPLLLITEEFLNFAVDEVKDKKWCRLSLRTRGGHILVSLEIGFHNRKEYNRRRFLDMIGNEMIIRQQTKQTRILVREKDGMMFYSLKPDKLKLAVMVME